MTRLLVSVRNANEARAALAGGADLIDIKEPARGALGAATTDVWSAVRAAVGDQRPVSAALGELGVIDLASFDADACEGLAYVKAGLAEATIDDRWRQRLRTLQERLPTPTQLVAVAYADHARANAPSPWLVLDAARELDLRVLLIDTYDKQHGPLWQSLSDAELHEFCLATRQAKIAIALAGSLSLACMPRALELEPEWIAVRGAACPRGRASEVASSSVSALKAAISGVPAKQ